MSSGPDDRPPASLTSRLADVSRLAADLASAPADSDITPLITTRLRALTGATAVTFSVFEPDTQILRLQGIQADGFLLRQAQRLLGDSLVGMPMPVPPETRAEMLSLVVARIPDLTTLSFGVIPPLVGRALERILDLGEKVVLIFQREGRLVGTSTILMRRGAEPVPDDVLHLFANVVSASVLRHSAERERARSEQRFRSIFDAANDGIFIHDTQSGAIVDANRTSAEMYGYAREELRTLDVSALSDEAGGYTKARALEMMRAAQSQPQTFEWHSRRRDGTCFWTEVKMRRATLGDEERLIVLVRDISARKEAEEAHARLEQQVRQAQKMESIGRLAGGVAHDFNNLLTAILGNLELAAEDIGPNAAVHERLAEVTRAAENAAALTRQLLTFSRKQIIDPRVVQLDGVLGNVERMLRRLIGEHITLRVLMDQGVLPVRVDPLQIEQALVNLAVNARDAMPDGGVLTIRATNVTVTERPGGEQEPPGLSAGTYALLAVSDTGTGMSEEVRRQAFEPFFTTKSRGQGTGLGLSMVYGAVSQHGGHVELESALGQGTTVRLYLPVAATPVTMPQALSTRTAPAAGGPETILLAEDERGVRELARRVLERHGYRVLACEDGAEALRRAAEEQSAVHLLVTDLVMPGMNGRDLAAELTKSQPKMKVLFTSGYSDDLVARHGVLEPGVAFLSKPYTPGVLLDRVREILDSASPGESSRLR